MLSGLFAWVGGALAAIGGFFGVVRTIVSLTVPQGNWGVKCRFNKPINDKNGTMVAEVEDPETGEKHHIRFRVRGPGFVWGIPGVHTVKPFHVLGRPIVTEPQIVRLGDGSSRLVKAALTLNIHREGLFDALFTWEDYDSQIRIRFAAEVLEYLSTRPHVKRIDKMARQIQARLEARLLAGGFHLSIVTLSFQDFQSTHITQWTEQVATQVEAKFNTLVRLYRKEHGPGAEIPMELFQLATAEDMAPWLAQSLPAAGISADMPQHEIDLPDTNVA